MTDDEDDRRRKGEERRHPSEKDETSMPRRARDSGRVRAAIRNELEEVAEEGGDIQAETGPKPGRKPARAVISIENADSGQSSNVGSMLPITVPSTIRSVGWVATAPWV